jgi:2-polyprenyl-6-methoxyphenol hydroxylase-like FAD-dependent oxidoreductase
LNPILLGQSRTQGILRNHLKRLGREVELGTELVDIEQNDDYVTCRLKKTKDDGSVEDETLKVDYVVGTDGGRGL